MIVVASVPHSATHFVEAQCEAAGFEAQHKSRDFAINVYGRAHVRQDGRSRKLLEWHRDQGHTLVSPMRHPMACAQSWANRRKAIVPPTAGREIGQSLIECWQAMIEWGQYLGQHWLPVDTPDRDRYYREFTALIGAPDLVTDWAPVHSRKPHPRVLTRTEIEAVNELMKHPFFERFYGQQDEYLLSGASAAR